MWIYKNNMITSIEDMPEDSIGFIYIVYHKPTNKKYIGKKILEVSKKLPPLKGKKRVRRVKKESDWLSYFGSNDTIREMIKEGKQDEFKREILFFAKTKRQLSYLETRELFKRDVLESDEYFNSNILGKFYKGNI